jgi:hypothetical protein
LVCPLSRSDDDASGGGSDDKFSTFRVSYFDGDGPGSADEVAVQLVQTVPQTQLQTGPQAQNPGYVEKSVCGWTSNSNGALPGTQATLTCPHTAVPGAFYDLYVALKGQAAFVGARASK